MPHSAAGDDDPTSKIGRSAFALPRGTALRCLVWMGAVGLYLVPVWGVDYFPSQDGPAHLYNAGLIKDHGRPGTRIHEFFAIRHEPVPNWLTQALLATMLRIVPPFCAERVLLSLYVLGFAVGYAYFLRAVRPQAVWLPLLAFPLAFNRCLWMGFYNYCLGMALFWLVLGYFLRRLDHWTWPHTAALMGMAVLLYFTHLMAFVLAGTALAILAWGGSRPLRNLAHLLCGFTPACVLAAVYFGGVGFGDGSLGGRLTANVAAKLRTGEYLAILETPALMFDRETFGPIVDMLPWAGLPLLILTLACFAAAIFLPATTAPRGRRLASLLALVLVMTALYVVVPDHLGREGGYLKQRLPPLLWLLVIALMPEPGIPGVRCVFAALLVGVLAFHAVANLAYARRESQAVRAIARYRDVTGTGQVYFSIFAERYDRLSNPLLHAADYFAFGTDNLNLQNYQANTNHFPVKFKDVAYLSADNVGRSPYGTHIDMYVFWGVEPRRFKHLLKGFEPIVTDGQLSIWRKKPES